MLLSFRNRRIVRRILMIFVAVLLAILILTVGIMIYLQRYLVYTRDKVYLDFSLKPIQAEALQDRPGYEFPGLEILGQPDAMQQNAIERVLSGYEITHEMLSDTAALQEHLREIPSDSTLLIDVKDGFGNFYYASEIEAQGVESRDLVSEVLTEWKKQGYYLCARVNALRDYSYALEYTDFGLPLASGALWMDEDGCYWLDPANHGVQVRLVQICEELFSKGFDEVVFQNFYFPDSEYINYQADEDRTAILDDCAHFISLALEGRGVVSIQLQPEQNMLPSCPGRYYYRAENALSAQSVMDEAQKRLENPAAQMVFLTDSHDTRFRLYGQLRSFGE